MKKPYTLAIALAAGLSVGIAWDPTCAVLAMQARGGNSGGQRSGGTQRTQEMIEAEIIEKRRGREREARRQRQRPCAG